MNNQRIKIRILLLFSLAVIWVAVWFFMLESKSEVKSISVAPNTQVTSAPKNESATPNIQVASATKDDSTAPNIQVVSEEKVISLEALYITFPNVDDLEKAADLIVIGTPTSDFKGRKHVTTYFGDGAMQDFYTLTELNISKVIKKPTDLILESGGSLEVIEPLGYQRPEKKEIKMTRNDYLELKKDSKYVVFLRKNTQGQYVVSNLNLGKFKLDGTSDFIKSKGSDETERRDHLEKEYQRFLESVLNKYNLN